MPQKRCSGPCDQGRKPCATPLACDQQDYEYDEGGVSKVLQVAMVLGILCCSYFIWQMLGVV